MKTALKLFFLNNWQRKTISILLALIIWLVVSHSLTTTRTFNNVPVRIINIPPGKTAKGLLNSGYLTKRLNLTITGASTLIEELSPKDLEVVIDATNEPDEWIATINKKNLNSLNPDISLKGISQISHPNFIIHTTRTISERIPVAISAPIGDTPREYELIDVWPYNLMMNVTGPEETINELKGRSHKLTFNLSEISKHDLDLLQNKNSDVVSFAVPQEWKQLMIPQLSETPIRIDDPLADLMRIDFIHRTCQPIGRSIPVTLFIPQEQLSSLKSETIELANNPFIQKKEGFYSIDLPLYAKGVSQLFMKIVQEMLQIVIVVDPNKQQLNWSIQIVNPRALEDAYVAELLPNLIDENGEKLHPRMREEYLRNRFRSYVNRMELFKSNHEKFDLKIALHNKELVVTEGKEKFFR